VHDIFYGIIPG
jgi:hypothetical protein